jgi:hypothetical protein
MLAWKANALPLGDARTDTYCISNPVTVNKNSSFTRSFGNYIPFTPILPLDSEDPGSKNQTKFKYV